MMKIYLGADHGGFKMKEELKGWLEKEGYEVADAGAHELDKDDDFVDYALPVANKLVTDQEGRGILLCRNGVGISVAANRFLGVRCALGFDIKQVEKARTDDDVNCLSLPADYLDLKKAKELVETFLKTEFKAEEDKYQRRVIKLDMIGEMGGGGGGGCCGGGCGDGCEDGECEHC